MRKVALLGLIALSGCSIFNPYNGEFTCPKTYNGKCTTVPSAYQESLGPDAKPVSKADAKELKKNTEEIKSSPPPVIESRYQDAVFEKLTGLLKEPMTPMIAPPQVIRVLILPYKGEGARLFMPRYVYIMVDEPKWVIGNPVGEENGARTTALPHP